VKYLVMPNEETTQATVAIVIATDKEDAKEQYALAIGIKDRLFLEHVYDRAINWGLAETFVLVTDADHNHFARTGNALIDEREFERRVKAFFIDHEEWATAYLNMWADRITPTNRLADCHPFPKSMLLHVYQNIDWIELIAIPTRELEVKRQ